MSKVLLSAPIKLWRAHGDLLLFQLASWLSGQMLFAVFGLYAIRGALSHIAFVEVASAFFGTTFASIAFRIGFSSAGKTRVLIGIRFVILMILAMVAAAHYIAWTWVIGIAPSLLTPAHFPVVYGARKLAACILVGARALACVMCMACTLSAPLAFAVYFAPGVFYALALYVIHLADWTKPLVVRHQTSSVSPVDSFAFLPAASAGLFFMQAGIVSHIAAASPKVAVVERFVRSAYSLTYPYLMRIARLDTALRHIAGWLGFIVPVAALALGVHPALLAAICVPVCIDLVTTNLFRVGPRRLRLLTAWVLVFAALLMWTKF